MDICGLWKVREMHLVTPDGEKVFTADSQVDNDMYAEIVQMCKYIMEFAPDGTVLTLYRIPEGMPQEEIDEAVSRGAVVAGDFLAMEKREWKEDGGKILYNTQIVGEFLGEEVSPWAEITEDENGEITMMEMIRLKRV